MNLTPASPNRNVFDHISTVEDLIQDDYTKHKLACKMAGTVPLIYAAFRMEWTGETHEAGISS